ncbi:methionyl-tRNA formyltransferase [Arcicella sp. LKC2W]|uniref:methionyl-tRNA formyltransferase n=1 Tax=Arcicella sp. LKC2W TaxID=2984198 RepID=UPI002B1EDA89|nr:methionyl-tRNA formyltransferase [Arcicella sp. LKC2W]MEA5459267.1 methionyl-tRNA formyltransferase [Arcicella sp. LKC2W]
MKIIFMGTPDFAVESLRILVENNYNVVAVITAPDKPIGRGQKLGMSAVKEYVLANAPHIPILQPEKLKNPDFLAELKSYQADLQIVVAFRMLPEVVWAMPSLGTFNLHGSLLPQYRGAAPINWAIINGETETGVTTFFLKQDIDTGSIIFQEKETIALTDNVGDVYVRLMHKGADLVLKTVKAIEAGNYPQEPQDESVHLNHAPKIFKETCQIDWNQPVKKIYDFIRGLSPYPVAWTMLNDKTCRIYEAKILEAEDPTQPSPMERASEAGSYTTDGKKYIHFQCVDGILAIENLQLEGKKRMGIEEFLRGYRL